MRTRIKLTRAGEAFRGRLTATQTDLMCEALSALEGWASTDETLTVQLGAGREEVRRLYDRLQGDHKTPREFTLTARELHVIHAAITAVAPMFLSNRAFSEEAFYNRTGFFRENFDAMASSIVGAVSEATTP
ncbi:hypothetical protein ACG2OD_08385 [Streptomyces sp. PDY-4]|uniref:Uncharacterized protein n=1 Tax=Streptomyces fungicidicus TaxID=68203 RepID=A0A494V154_9ACTN|nr:hypothetical protein [Streptomyces fungicidicus]AYL38436.1 hypothetical protein CNQ36_25345 [Streptomyces fungicidicus]